MDNENIKEILEYLERPNTGDCFVDDKLLNYEQVQLLLDYITNLQEKVNQYENPDDLTLFYMWLDEKAKDKIKQLQEENNYYFKKNNELSILNTSLRSDRDDYKSRNEKAIEYIKSYNLPKDLGSLNECPISVGELKQLLNILQGEYKDVKDKR